MKSKIKKRLIAFMLCMVLVLSSAISAFADELPNSESQDQIETMAEAATEGEPVVTSLDTSSEEQQPIADTQTEEAVQEQAEAPAAENQGEAAPQVESNDQNVTTPSEETITSNEPIECEATQLTQEVDNGNDTKTTVVADIPAGAFHANASEITMEVKRLSTEDVEDAAIVKLIKNALTTKTSLSNYVLYNVTFKVNGIETEPLKSVDINFKGSELKVKDSKKATAFYFAPAKSEEDIEEDRLVELPQREAKIKELLDAGTDKTREQLEDEFDFSELTVKDDKAEELKMEVRKNRIYGCYVVENKKESCKAKTSALTKASNSATLASNDAITSDYTANDLDTYANSSQTYTVKLWRNDKNTDGKDSTVATITNLTASKDGDGNSVVEVNLSGKKATASNSNYVFYGWSKVPNANFGRSDVVYCGDASAKIKYGSKDAQTVFTYDGNSKITFSTSDFKNNTLDLYAVYAVDRSIKNNQVCGRSTTVQFFIRYDGVAPYEPSTYGTNLYTSGITVDDALYYYQHIYNNSDAVSANLRKVPTTEQIKKVYGSYDDSKYYIEWYVIKKELAGTYSGGYDTGTWHVDGVIRKKTQWTLRYDANTSDTVNDIIGAKQYEYDNNVNIKNTQNSNGTQADAVPVRTGYTFAGWNTKADGTGTAFALNNTITVGKSDYHIYKNSADTGESATNSNDARVVTLYAQWTKDYVPPTPVITTDKELSHEKYIKKNDDGTYDLTLNVSGAVGSKTYQNKLDVLFVMDTSGSMDEKMGSSTRFKNQKQAVKNAVDKISKKGNVDARFAIVSFDTMAGVNSDWTKEASKLSYPENTSNYPDKGYWNGQSRVPAGGTNYQEGLNQAKTLLASARNEATKIVVFLSDGDPTFYTNDSGNVKGNGTKYDSTAMDYAKKVLKTMTNMQYFYTVGVGPKDSYDHLKELRSGVAAGIITNNFDGTDANKLKDAFDSIIKDATSLLCSDVTITDTLTDYVELKNAVPTVVVKDENGKVIEKLKGKDNKKYSADYFLETSIATVDGKTQIQLKTKNDYQLEEGYTYYVTVKIQPTETAFNKYDSTGEYPDVGDANTDEYVGADKKPGHDTRNDGTSSGQSGFYSNVKATVKYSYNGETKIEEYDKPVVQVETVFVEKRWVGTTPETGHVLVALLKNGQIVTDRTNNNLPRIIELSKDHWTGQFVVEKASNYTVAELRQDDEGTITYDGQKYSIVETNGIVTVDGLTYKAVYSTEENNPNRIITNVENSKKIRIVKTSANSDSVMLDGAEFTLVDKDENPVIIGEGNVSNTYTSSQGVVLEAGLNAGTYTLTEIKAPSGYLKLKNPIKLVITSSEVKLEKPSEMVTIEKTKDTNDEDIWIIKVKNDTLYELPSTGGTGIYLYMIGGMMLMLIAIWILYKNKCREVLEK